MKISLDYMELSQLLELEKEIQRRKKEISETVKVLPPITIDELKMWNNGVKVHAIAAYRDRTGLGLIQSRQAFMVCVDGNEANRNIK